MRRVIGFFYYFLLRLLLALRYKIRVEGLDQIEKKGGLLFLANHPAEVDPAILLDILWQKFNPHPVAIDYLFQSKILNYFLKFVGAFPVPHFEHGTNSFKIRMMEKTYDKIFSALRNNENILIYPSGGLKRQALDIVGGASGTQTILQNCPECTVVLIKTSGLWGSSFSRAITGTSPNIFKVAKARAIDLLKNFIFFMPKRHITITIEAPKNFPYQGSRLEINKYLENWYNKEGAEPLQLVPYQFWSDRVLEAYESKNGLEKIDLSEVPEEVKSKIKDEIATLALRNLNEVDEKHYLSKDLGLDSLDSAQLILFLKDQFGVDAHALDLVRVEDVIAIAAKLKTSKTINEEVERKPDKRWRHETGRPKPHPPTGDTLIEAFLNMCDQMGGYVAGGDLLFGEISYRRMKVATLLLAEKIRKWPESRVGIMLPASMSVNILIFASMLAKKIPVMINWTLGKRNLSAITEESQIKTTISSWNFLDRLENVDFNGLDEQILFLEEIGRSATLKEKLQAFFLSFKNGKTLLKRFDITAKADDVAAILFTSGTESLPKGVPLTHNNILSNLKDAFQSISVSEKDIMIGALPPFHSFGFSVTGMFPFLVGMKAVFYPNPTDGKKMASVIEKWGVTILCMVPSFLKNLARVASKNQLKTLRLIVTGAEKTSQELFERMASLNPHSVLSEGYGITECSPILTLNPLDNSRIGVGKPLPSVKVLIVNPETFEPVGFNKEGLILVHGPNIFAGYLNRQLASPFLNIDSKVWYNTGDLGYLTDKEYLVLSGRLKRFVKVGGEMISLGAIEETLVDSASLKGWKLETDLPSLAVVAKEEEGKKGEIHLFTTFSTTVEEVNDVLKKKGMSNLIKVKSVNQVPFIPLLGTGKIDYKNLTGRI